jgi:hypothetical protein
LPSRQRELNRRIVGSKVFAWQPAVIERLEDQLRQNSWLSEIHRRFEAIGLPDSWVVAGCIAQTVWNLACGRVAESGIKDIDIVYFDADDLSAVTEAGHERRLADYFSDLPAKLDVKNQARVHLWYEQTFGYTIAPYRSTADAIASFPTTATAVGVRWAGNKFECCAPFGLEDLFALRVLPNKRQITRTIYAAKVKRWQSIWPELTFVAWDDAD